MKEQLLAMLGNLGPQANTVLEQNLQPYDEKQFQGLFQKSFVDPAMMRYEQDLLPAIRESAVSQNAGSSSSLNQALAASAQDLATGLGTQMGQFYQQQQGQQMDAMKLLASLFGVQTQQPIVQQNQSPFSQVAGLVGAASPWRWRK